MISCLEKLTDQASDSMGPTDRESGREWPISCGRSGHYIWIMRTCDMLLFALFLNCWMETACLFGSIS